MTQKKNSQKKSEIDFKRMDNTGKWLLGMGLLFLTVGPALFVQDFGFLDFTETGQIGDTIGGIASPFINLVGAALVYLSFREQMKANNNQYKILLDEVEHRKYSNEKDYLNNLFKQTEDVWNGLDELVDTNASSIYEGLYKYINSRNTNVVTLENIISLHINLLRKIIVAMNHISQLYDTIILSDLDKKDRQMMLDRLTYFILDRLVFFTRCSKAFIEYPNKKETSEVKRQIFDAYKIEYESLESIRDTLIKERKLGIAGKA